MALTRRQNGTSGKLRRSRRRTGEKKDCSRAAWQQLARIGKRLATSSWRLAAVNTASPRCHLAVLATVLARGAAGCTHLFHHSPACPRLSGFHVAVRQLRCVPGIRQAQPQASVARQARLGKRVKAQLSKRRQAQRGN